jgi:hypothetical protein
MGGFIATVSIFAVIGLAIGVGLWMEQQKKKQRQEVLNHGVRVLAWIVQANTALFQPGRGDFPAQVIITFDDIPDLPDYLERLGKKLYSLKSGYGIDPLERQVAKLVKDETYVPDLRVKLPPEFTGGQVVYSCHVVVERQYLLYGCLRLPFIECMALPGEKGVLCMVPYEMYPEVGLSG